MENVVLSSSEPVMVVSQADDQTDSVPSMVRLRIQGLRRNEPENPAIKPDVEQIAAIEEIVDLPSNAPLSALWDKLRELGYVTPNSVSRNEKDWRATSTKVQLKEFEQIEVVQDQPAEPGKSIHIDDRLIAYTNRRFGKPVELNLTENDANNYGTTIDSLKDSRGLEIMFHRTIRMPDDDKLHQLPGSLGAFPLYSVAGYSTKLPDNIVQQGGVFLPMWQREALWMSLEAPYSVQYALRFFVGRINAVSGSEMNENRDTGGDIEDLQDYVVVPGQEWLDGICVAPGIVRQFVAMPLGSGYTVEGQKTGKEKHGGLQIEIIPSFQKNLRTWLKDPDLNADSAELANRLSCENLDEFKTPRELGLGIDDKIRLYPAVAFEHVPCTLLDILADGQLDQEIVLKSTYVPRTLFPYGRRMMDSTRSDRYSDVRAYGGDDEPAWRPAMGHYYGQALGLSYDVTRQERDDQDILEGNGEDGMDRCDEGYPCDGHDLAMPNGTTSASTNALGPARATQASAGPVEAETKPANPKIATKSLKAMGLAAGGKLVQDIYHDRNPAHIWNTEAAKLVHVHILDPASCEAVTHIVPPPPPIDAMGYIEDGGSFFVVEEQPENRVDGGDFDNVKSVSAMDREKGVATEPSLDPSQPIQCKCSIRLCDCVIRPCNHRLCNVCVREIDPSSLGGAIISAEPQSRRKWFCPTCKTEVKYVAGFSAPMNLPGEETIKTRVAVNVLEVKDGRVAFKSIQRSRI